jgi:hypothetical protein
MAGSGNGRLTRVSLPHHSEARQRGRLPRGPDGTDLVVWRWYDTVVLGTEDDGSVRLWERVHGEVIAQARASSEKQGLGRERTHLPAFREPSGGSPTVPAAPPKVPTSNWTTLTPCTPRTTFGQRCSTRIHDLVVDVAQSACHVRSCRFGRTVATGHVLAARPAWLCILHVPRVIFGSARLLGFRR